MSSFDIISRRAAAVRHRRKARRGLIMAVALTILLAGCDNATYKTKSGDLTQDLLIHITLTSHVETSETTTYPSGGHVTQSANATWTVSYVGRFFRGTPHVAVDQTWDLEDVTGTVSWDGSGPNGPLSCTGTLSRRPDLTESDVSQLMTVEPPSGPLESEPFKVAGYVLTKAQVQSSDTNPADAQCNTEVAIGFLSNGPQSGSVAPGIEAGWEALITPTARWFDENANPASDTFSWSGPQPSAGNTTSTLQVSGDWRFS